MFRSSLPKQLARHYKGTFAGGQDWQARSKMMYKLASDVAKVVGMDVAESEFAITLKANAKTLLQLKLRNWTNKPRQWKAKSSVKWLVPARAGGTADGIEYLEVRVRGDLRGPEKRSAGVLTITDVATGRAYLVKIAVTTPR